MSIEQVPREVTPGEGLGVPPERRALERLDPPTSGAAAPGAPARLPGTTPPWVLRLLATATTVTMALLLGGALAYAPEDRLQGAAQRIFYIHVPSAWIGMLAFLVVFVASIAVLATRSSRWDRLAASSAEVGVVFTTAVLLTGPLWARPVWGTYWDWDPRLTSYTVLWLLYLSYLALRGYVAEPSRRARYSAVLGIVAFLDVPLVYLSVRWWRSLHPGPVVANPEGPQLPTSMLAVLLVGIAAFTLFFVLLVRLRIDNAVRREHLEGLDLDAAELAGSDHGAADPGRMEGRTS
jgi:heme exporter protein C